MSNSIDRLSSLLERFRVRAHMFHTGPLCGVTHFDAKPGRGFLHVLRRGEMRVTHRPKTGAARRVVLTQPSLLFYPRPLAHDFHHAPAEGSELTCAWLDFDGQDRHPLVRGLPPFVVLPLAEVHGLGQTLELLFAETDQLRCGQRLLADRLFEVVLLQLLRWLLDNAPQAGLSTGLLRGLADPQLAAALVAMHEQPGQAWSVERMAQTAGMSRSAFAARFKELLGEAPGEHLALWRITIAQARLLEGRSIKIIADELGYANASALSRLFTARIGLSPRHWAAAQGQ